MKRFTKIMCTIHFIYIKNGENLCEDRQKAYLSHTKFW